MGPLNMPIAHGAVNWCIPPKSGSGYGWIWVPKSGHVWIVKSSTTLHTNHTRFNAPQLCNHKSRSFQRYHQDTVWALI